MLCYMFKNYSKVLAKGRGGNSPSPFPEYVVQMQCITLPARELIATYEIRAIYKVAQKFGTLFVRLITSFKY